MENPNVCIQKHLNLLVVCVFVRIHARRLVGQHFFDNTVTGQTYLKMLENLRGQTDEDPELANIVHFMQVCASPHYALIVR